MVQTSQNIEESVREFFKDKPVKRVYLFGSYARGDENEDSDVDIIGDFPREVGLFGRWKMRDELSEILNRKVDLLNYDSIKKSFWKYIGNDLKLIYGTE